MRRSGVAFSWVFLIGILLLLISSWRIVSTNFISHSPIWTIHANAALYAVSQVIAGKTLLYNLPSQYGLFPELIAPLFKIIGGTIFNISLFFATLQFISLCGLFWILSKLVKHSSLIILGGIGLIVFTFHTIINLLGNTDFYFQYWPIRFFWPAISVPVFYFYLCKKNIFRSTLVSLAGALGVIWVVDTGLFIIGAFGGYLFFKFLTLHLQKQSNSSSQYLRALALHLLIALGLVGSFLIILRLKAHHPLNLFWLFEYQKIFYSLGFNMTPLPREIHPWMSVLGVYLLGIISSFIAWYHQKDHIRIDMILYLSLLGIGLFVYYEGRSHIYNLEKACWPAIIIIIFWADSFLCNLRNHALPKIQIFIPITIISVLLMSITQFAINTPRLFVAAKYRYLTRHLPIDPLAQSEINFIKAHSQPKQECLILSANQGIYYLETGLASPVGGPGLIEIVLKEDQDRLFSAVFTKKISCLFVGLGPSGYFNNLNINKWYNIVDTNPEHSMIFMQPKSSAN